MALNKNSLLRIALVDMAMHGVVHIKMRRQHGEPLTIRATLLPTSQECAIVNTEAYYASKGTTRAKASRERAKRKKLLETVETWQDKLDKSINMLYVVDADEMRWKPVSMRAVVSVDEWEVIIPNTQKKSTVDL